MQVYSYLILEFRVHINREALSFTVFNLYFNSSKEDIEYSLTVCITVSALEHNVRIQNLISAKMSIKQNFARGSTYHCLISKKKNGHKFWINQNSNSQATNIQIKKANFVLTSQLSSL